GYRLVDGRTLDLSISADSFRDACRRSARRAAQHARRLERRAGRPSRVALGYSAQPGNCGRCAWRRRPKYYLHNRLLPDPLDGSHGYGLRIRLAVYAAARRAEAGFVLPWHCDDAGIHRTARLEVLWRSFALVQQDRCPLEFPVVSKLHEISRLASI